MARGIAKATRKKSPGIVVKIERGDGDFYHITLAAGQQLEAEMAKRGTIVGAGNPRWFRLTRCETPNANKSRE